MAIEDIRISLQLLAETVAGLEEEIIAQEEAAAAQKQANKPQNKKTPPQTDLFGGWTPKAANDKNVLLAKKLDSTIDRVQALLRGGA